FEFKPALNAGYGEIPYNVYNEDWITNQTFQFAKKFDDGVSPHPNSKLPLGLDEFNSKVATNKQKGNFGEIISSDNILTNQSIKEAGYDLKPVGRPAPSRVDDKIVRGIDGLYENTNPNSNVKYVVDEAKFGSSQLGKTRDGKQMSNDWLTGASTKKSRILKAVDNDGELASEIEQALNLNKLERVLYKVDSNGNVKTFRLDENGDIIGEWP